MGLQLTPATLRNPSKKIEYYQQVELETSGTYTVNSRPIQPQTQRTLRYRILQSISFLKKDHQDDDNRSDLLETPVLGTTSSGM